MSFVFDIEKATFENEEYRKILYTGIMQLVLMSIPVGKDIELEVHPNTDQFLRVEKGKGEVRFGKDQSERIKIKDGSAIMVKRGTYHRVINTGNESLKLYTIYSPPEHGVKNKYKDLLIKVLM